MIPVSVSILVYIEVASAVKSRAFSGMSSCSNSFIMVVEFFMYDWTRGSRSSFCSQARLRIQLIDY